MKSLLLLVLFLPGFALGCWPGETEESRVVRWETGSCVQSGYCFDWGLNPENGQYEYYYGWHYECRGTRQRQVADLVCKREDGSTYAETEEGYWSSCNF